MISSVRLDGSTACMTIPGATDTEVFRSHVREVLCPTLRRGDLVIMDNLAPHKSVSHSAPDQKGWCQSPLPARLLPGPQPD